MMMDDNDLQWTVKENGSVMKNKSKSFHFILYSTQSIKWSAASTGRKLQDVAANAYFHKTQNI